MGHLGKSQENRAEDGGGGIKGLHLTLSWGCGFVVANMGVSYPQLLKDVCGWEATQWESTGQCACHPVFSSQHWKNIRYYKEKSRTRSFVSSRACLFLKRKRKYQPSWGYAWAWDEA